jgi:hypothetical protein
MFALDLLRVRQYLVVAKGIPEIPRRLGLKTGSTLLSKTGLADQVLQ